MGFLSFSAETLKNFVRVSDNPNGGSSATENKARRGRPRSRKANGSLDRTERRRPGYLAEGVGVTQATSDRAT